jgi:hypothetical protein
MATTSNVASLVALETTQSLLEQVALEYALEQLVQRRPDDPIGFVANKLLEADIQARAAPLGLGKAVRASQRAAAKKS